MKTEKLSESAYLVEIPTELLDPNEKPYLDACSLTIQGKNNYLLLDFSKVKHINGLGISMLVKLSALTNKRKQSILAFNLSSYYRRVFSLTGLDHAILMCRDATEAIKIAGLPPSHDIQPTEPVITSDIDYWSAPVDKLAVSAMPPDAINMNMEGRRVVGPVDGFGVLWQKTYRLPLNKINLSPDNVIDILKKEFSNFQPNYNHFYPGSKGIVPGEVVAIDSSTPGGPVSTGVMVLYADKESFTFITPQGHPESGWVTFSVNRAGENLVVQILGLARANDPIYELAFRTVGSGMQIRIWKHVLESLAKYLKIRAEVSVEALCIDPRVRWSQSRNVWYNAQARTILASPVWWIRKKLRRGNRE